jgi:hypothetical protein
MSRTLGLLTSDRTHVEVNITEPQASTALPHRQLECLF